ncbi:hypothetical protein T492DRAFT_543706 [Pavlovales sp. CCMP2436]|nr:hypothetical protein T492DRAFT_543706 [Pavlovales sp. CCMP2436]
MLSQDLVYRLGPQTGVMPGLATSNLPPKLRRQLRARASGGSAGTVRPRELRALPASAHSAVGLLSALHRGDSVSTLRRSASAASGGVTVLPPRPTTSAGAYRRNLERLGSPTGERAIIDSYRTGRASPGLKQGAHSRRVGSARRRGWETGEDGQSSFKNDSCSGDEGFLSEEELIEGSGISDEQPIHRRGGTINVTAAQRKQAEKEGEDRALRLRMGLSEEAAEDVNKRELQLSLHRVDFLLGRIATNDAANLQQPPPNDEEKDLSNSEPSSESDEELAAMEVEVVTLTMDGGVGVVTVSGGGAHSAVEKQKARSLQHFFSLSLFSVSAVL